MPYTFLKHTADARMSVTGKTLEELFTDALLGMVQMAGPIRPVREKQAKRKIALEAPDITALLIDFLNEAIFWMSAHNEAYTAVHFISFSEKTLVAELTGYKARLFTKDIKAATYHEAEIKQENGRGWQTKIVFDI